MISIPKNIPITLKIRTRKDGEIDMRWKGVPTKPAPNHPWKSAWSFKRMKESVV